MKKHAMLVVAALSLLMITTTVSASDADSTQALEEANQYLYEASGYALEYVYSGNSGSKDVYLQKMKKVDQAIAAYEKTGDRRMAAVLKKRRDAMRRKAKEMFDGYESNDGDVGLQARAFQEATDELNSSMQDAIEDEEIYDEEDQQVSAEQKEFFADLMKYQMAMRNAGMSGVKFASGGPVEQKQAFESAMAKLDALSNSMQASAAKAGLDKDPRFKKMLGAFDGVRQDFAAAAAKAFPQREANGKADAQTLAAFKQAEQALLNALEECE